MDEVQIKRVICSLEQLRVRRLLVQERLEERVQRALWPPLRVLVGGRYRAFRHSCRCHRL